MHKGGVYSQLDTFYAVK